MNQQTVIGGLAAILLGGVGGAALYSQIGTASAPNIVVDRLVVFNCPSCDAGVGGEICASAWATPATARPMLSRCVSFSPVQMPPVAATFWLHEEDPSGDAGLSVTPDRFVAFRAPQAGAGDGGWGVEVCGNGVCVSKEVGPAFSAALNAKTAQALQDWMAIAADGG